MENPPRIAMSVVSTNRPEYLAQTLESQRYLDWCGCEVTDRILIDDYPLGRDDRVIYDLAEQAGYETFLHTENWGIGRTWQQLWNHLKDRRDIDYIWHQEDDAKILAPVRMLEMIDFLQDPKVSIAILMRRSHLKGDATYPTWRTSDIVCGSLRGQWDWSHYYFNPFASLYSFSCVQLDYHAWFRMNYPNDPALHTANVNEGLYGKMMLEGYGKSAMLVKGHLGEALVQHIGEYTVGQKVLPDEPGYPAFAHIDPTKRYYTNSPVLYEK